MLKNAMRAAQYIRKLSQEQDQDTARYIELFNKYQEAVKEVEAKSKVYWNLETEVAGLHEARTEPMTEEDVYRNQELMEKETRKANEAFSARREYFEASRARQRIEDEITVHVDGLGGRILIPDEYISFLKDRLKEYNPIILKHSQHIAIVIKDPKSEAIEHTILITLKSHLDLDDAMRRLNPPFIINQPFVAQFDKGTNHIEELDKVFPAGYSFSDEFIDYLENTVDDMRVMSSEGFDE